MAPPGDPLDWSVDEVVEALCNTTDWWRDGRPNSLLPDSNPFETSLREQEINGYALLTYLTDQTLKDEFGIKAIGRRAAVSWAIDKLREQSPKYVEHLAAQRSVFAGGSAAQSFAGHTSLYPRGVTGWLGSISPPSEILRQGQATPTYESHLPTILETEAETGGRAGGSAKRLGETIVQDGHGRKRRKLNLVEPAAVLLPPSSRHLRTLNVSTSHRKKFPVDRIFYGDAAFGQALEEDDDLDFQHFGEVPAAIGPYVYRQFIHFVRNPERKELLQNGKKVVAVLPYRSEILPENHPRSATVVESGDHSARATRQDALRLRSNIPYDSGIPYEDDNGHEFYSFAEKWSKENDTVLPALGESDSEGYSSSFEAELNAEEEERERVRQESKQEQLSKEDVLAIINERIQELVDIWKMKKLPMRQRTARTVWREGRRPRDRVMLRAAAEENIKKINKRLNKWKEAIADGDWHKKAEVMRQCATLEESVWQREEELWHISVWELKLEPARVFAAAPPRHPRNRPIPKDDGNDLGEEVGDWVNSESELESDGLTDFVEDDQHLNETAPAEVGSESLGGSRDTTPAPDIASLPDGSESENAGATTTEDNDFDIVDRPARKSATPQAIRTPKGDSAPQSTRSVIDLTALSDGSGPLSPTPLQRSTLSQPAVTLGSQSTSNRFGGDPENSTIGEVLAWTFNELQERDDKKRLVLKILRTSTNAPEYKDMRAFVKAVSQKMLSDRTRLAMAAICRHERMVGIDDKEWQVLDRFARLYACWSTVRAKYWRGQPEKVIPTLVKLMKNLDTPQSKHDQDGFFKFVISILKRFKRSMSNTVSNGQYIQAKGELF